MKRFIGLLLFTAILMGCNSNVQTTSGSDYLSKYKNVPISGVGTSADEEDINKKVREVAAVEPILQFPARIGIAKIDRRTLAAISPEEAEAWKKAQDELGSGFGEFVPVNPLITEMVTDHSGVHGIINSIRLGAARQHLDAVLIYEEYSKEEISKNLLSLGDLSIVGGFILPSRSHEGQGFANGLLIDVIQGYPYGSIQATADKQTQVTSTWGWGADSRGHAFSERMKIEAGKQLAEEAVGMFKKLRTQLAKKNAAIPSGKQDDIR